jgi:hypothetical protein
MVLKYGKVRNLNLVDFIVLCYAPHVLPGEGDMKLRSRRLTVAGLIAVAGIAALSLLAQTADTDPIPIPDFLKGLPDYTLNSGPVQRFLYNYQMRANPDGSLPESPGRRVLTGIQAATPAVALTAPFTNIRNMRWQSIGPSPTGMGQIGFTLTNRPVSGRTVAVAAHPNDPHRWLIASAAGGIWETLDDGNTFAALTDASPTLAMGAVAYAPSAPNIIYAGTGEYTESSVSFGGEGVLKSVDGGKNWRQIADDFFKAGTAFSNIHVDPANPSILVAALTFGIFGRPDVFGATAPIGLFRSGDGGVHWTQTVSGPDGTTLEVVKTDFSRQYAGLSDLFSAPGSGVYRSLDGGQSWALVTGPWSGDPRGIGRVELAIAPSDPNRAYVTIQDAFNGGPNDGGLLGLWTTGNAWDITPVWTAINLAPTDNGSGTLGPCGWDRAFSSASRQCWYDLVLTVKPTDPDVLFFGGIPLWRFNRATNSWTEVSQTVSNPAGGIHADQHGAAWAGTRLVIGNDGGVWSTVDDGATWIDHNPTLATTQFYEGSLASDGSFALGGAQDNGTQLWTGSRSWKLQNGGDGAGNLISSALNWGFSSQNQAVRRTTNGGLSSVSVRGNYAGTAPFIGKTKECPASPGTVILNGTRVNRTTQFFTGPASALWSDRSGNFGLGVATAIAFGSNCNTYAVGFYGGQLRLTTTDGPNLAAYKDIDSASQVPNRPISSIVFDPANGKRVFVALSGFSNGSPQNIYVTDDYTATPVQWTNISVLVDAPVDVLAVDPADPSRIFAGTDFGIWLSVDRGRTWGHMGPATGLPIVPVFDIVIRGGRVVAFTHGRSAFMLSNFDINNDGVVNCRDLAAVRSALNSRIGEPRYSVAADLNNDNVVDVTDLTMMAQQLQAGSNCSAN